MDLLEQAVAEGGQNLKIVASIELEPKQIESAILMRLKGIRHNLRAFEFANGQCFFSKSDFNCVHVDFNIEVVISEVLVKIT